MDHVIYPPRKLGLNFTLIKRMYADYISQDVDDLDRFDPVLHLQVVLAATIEQAAPINVCMQGVPYATRTNRVLGDLASITRYEYVLPSCRRTRRAQVSLYLAPLLVLACSIAIALSQ